MLLRTLRFIPLFALGAAALGGALAACAGDPEPVVSEDPLEDAYGYGYSPSYGPTAPVFSCEPLPTTAKWHPPQGFHQAACTPAQVERVIRCFVTFEGDWDTCHAFAVTAPGCVTCAISKEGAQKYSALYRDHSATLHANVGGCVAQATGDVAADSCGARAVLDEQCLHDACSQCDFDDGEAAHCREVARAGVCSRYDGASACIDAATAEGGAATMCRTSGALADQARVLIPLFCGQ